VAPYSERLTVSWWIWPLTVAIAVGLAAELTIGAFFLRHWATFATAVVLAVAALLWLGRLRVRVTADAFHVDDATLPITAISAVSTVDAEGRRMLLGPEAEPLAFVVQRPWIATGVRVDLDDEADPTPYWYVSSRHPEALVAALHEAGAPAPATTE
jgi:hypothetical protein